MSGVLEWYYAIASRQRDNPATIGISGHMTRTHDSCISERRRFRPKIIQPTDIDPLTSKDDIYSAERVNGVVKFIIETNIALWHVDSEQKGKRRRCCAVMQIRQKSKRKKSLMSKTHWQHFACILGPLPYMILSSYMLCLMLSVSGGHLYSIITRSVDNGSHPLIQAAHSIRHSQDPLPLPASDSPAVVVRVCQRVLTEALS